MHFFTNDSNVAIMSGIFNGTKT